jgi:hypothetical protein
MKILAGTLAALEEKREESDQSHEGYGGGSPGVIEGSLLLSQAARKQASGSKYDVRTIRLRRGIFDGEKPSSEDLSSPSMTQSCPSPQKVSGRRFAVPAALTPLDVRGNSNSNKISLIPALLPETRPSAMVTEFWPEFPSDEETAVHQFDRIYRFMFLPRGTI